MKYIKVDLLAQLANVNNVGDILDELCVYVSEVDVGMARRAIRAIGTVGFKLPIGFETGVFEKLVEFLDLDVDYVQAEAVLVLMNLLRKYPERRGPMLDRTQRCLREAEEPAARAALIWLVGEYSREITEAPYMLEAIVDDYEDDEEVGIASGATAKLGGHRGAYGSNEGAINRDTFRTDNTETPNVISI